MFANKKKEVKSIFESCKQSGFRADHISGDRSQVWDKLTQKTM